MPISADAFMLAAERHLATGNVPEAVSIYEQALAQWPDDALLHDYLGIALQQSRQWARAEECHRRAVRLAPSFALAHNNLANALRAQGKWTQALAAFQEALRLRPYDADIACNLGLILQDGGMPDRAGQYYRLALSLRPNSASVTTLLGTTLVEQGLLEEAVAQFHATLKLDANQAVVYYYLCQMAAEGHCQVTPEEESHLEELLSSRQLPPPERSQCAFALAALRASQGAYDAAFSYYQEANDLRKRLLAEQDRAFDAQRHEELISRTIARYDRAYFHGVRDWGANTELPTFIIGMPRSGSTLVEQILASHPHVYGGGEDVDLSQFLLARSRAVGLSSVTAAAADAPLLLPDEQAARQLGTDYVQWMAARGQKDRGAGAPPLARAINKTLQNYLHLGLIATLFPRARIIHCRRHPLDVCLSCYFTNFGDTDFSWSLEDIGLCYRSYERLMAHWSKVLPLPIHEVRYEELVGAPEPQTRQLLSACGLDWDAQCLSFFKSRRAVRTASTIQVRKPISMRAVGRWHHYRNHLGPLFKALGMNPDTPST